MKYQPFSSQLKHWLKGKSSKTLADLESVFAEKSFAIAIMLLMFIPALPLPTGGITHIFEVIAALLCIELIAGRRTIWLPKSWRKRSLGKMAQDKVLPHMVRYIRWFEKYSRPRINRFLQNQNGLRLVGLLCLILTISAFIAPPFSGLDTLPALGVVVIMLSVILEDGLLFIFGCLVGGVGSGLIIGFGTAIVELAKRIV